MGLQLVTLKLQQTSPELFTTRFQSSDDCPSMVTQLHFGHLESGPYLWTFTVPCSHMPIIYDVFAKKQHLVPVFLAKMPHGEQWVYLMTMAFA